MPNVVALNSENTKSGSGKSFTGSATPNPILDRIAQAMRICWPKKTAQWVSHITQADERTVKFWLACETRMSVEAVAALLRTDDGFAILDAIMGDSKVAWWQHAKMAQDIRLSKIALEREAKRHEKLRAQLSLLDQ